jgi:hypothetical protein
MGVFSIDGLDVLHGAVASESTVGYIIDPFSSLDIKGFRIDSSSVAAFKFSNTEKSYSNTQGVAVTNPVTKETTYEKTTKNNGTIGVRVYEEATADHNYDGQYKTWQPSPIPTTTPSLGFNIHLYSGMPAGAWGSMHVSGCASPITSQHIFATGTAYINNVYSSQPQYTCDTNNSRNRTLYQSTSIYSGPSPADLQNIACASSAGEYIVPRQSVNQFGELKAIGEITLTPPTFDIGTSLGSKLQDKVKEIEFKRKEGFVELVIYYASKESLTKFGIDFSNTKQITAWPQAFEEKRQFCKVPDWYKG